MYGLPRNTETIKQLSKRKLFANCTFKLSNKSLIDACISKIAIINELNPASIKVLETSDIKSIFVLRCILKIKDFDSKCIEAIFNVIPQHMVLALEFEDGVKLAIFHKKLFVTDWMSLSECKINLNGNTMKNVWDNLVCSIGKFKIEKGKDLDAQIEFIEKKEKLLKEIDKLNNQVRSETQPRKKFDLHTRLMELKNKLDNLH